MDDSKFISKITDKGIKDVDRILALLNVHIIKSCGASNARIGMFTYNKRLGSFIKDNFSFVEELSTKSYEKYRFTMFMANFEKSLSVNKDLSEKAVDEYADLGAE